MNIDCDKYGIKLATFPPDVAITVTGSHLNCQLSVDSLNQDGFLHITLYLSDITYDTGLVVTITFSFFLTTDV